MPQKIVSDVSEETAPRQESEPVRKSLRVRTGVEHAFRVFTEGMDSWWPRSHHVGSSPMRRVVVEGRPEGAIYTDQEDGSACRWGTVLVWEPPHRFVMAWLIQPSWKIETDASKCSEVELRFTPADDGTTLVELEHRELHRHEGAWEKMRAEVGSEGGWGSLLGMFAAKAEEAV